MGQGKFSTGLRSVDGSEYLWFMPRISESTVAKIFDAARIEDVVGDFVQLKRSGSNLKGLSPFTNEKTPFFFRLTGQADFQVFQFGKRRERCEFSHGTRGHDLRGGTQVAGQALSDRDRGTGVGPWTARGCSSPRTVVPDPGLGGQVLHRPALAYREGSGGRSILFH